MQNLDFKVNGYRKGQEPRYMAIMAVVAWAGVAVGAAGLINNISQSNKAKNQATQAAQQNQIDVNKVNQDVNNQSIQNIALSNQLEQQYNPALNQLRGAAGNSLLSYVNALNPQQYTGTNGSVPVQSPLTALAQQKALTDLQNGGKLPQDVANQIMRSSAAQAGSVVGSGNGLGLLGRDLGARDIGLNSLQLYNQQLQNATGLGNTADQYAMQQQQLQLQQQLQQFNMGQQGFNNALNATNLANGFQMPQVGLSPSSVANIYAANQNQVAAGNQQAAAIGANANNAQLGFLGNLAGVGLSAWNASNGTGTNNTNWTNQPAVPQTTQIVTNPNDPNFCWVAREAYGTQTDDWMKFREWLLNIAPPELRNFYIMNGQQIASDISDNDALKTLIRHLMDAAQRAY